MATISEPNHLSGLFEKKSPMKIGLYYFTEYIWRLIELIISINFNATVYEPPRDMFCHMYVLFTCTYTNMYTSNLDQKFGLTLSHERQ